MGYLCPDRQTTADFLTSLTSPSERIVRPGYENKVPRTPDEFAAVWKQSEMYQNLRREIDEYDKENPIGGPSVERFSKGRAAMKSTANRKGSPYTLSAVDQVWLCLIRGFQRLRGDMSMTISQLCGNTAMALIIASVFYNMQATTESFFQRCSLLFFAVLFNAFSSSLEVRLIGKSLLLQLLTFIDFDIVCSTSHRGETIAVCDVPSILRSYCLHVM